MFRSSRDMLRVKETPKYEFKNDQSEVYSCDMCTEEGWYSETEVEIHKNNKHKKALLRLFDEEDYVCGLCYTKFDNNDQLMRHIKSEHLCSSEEAFRIEPEIFVCDMCSQIFFNKLHLIVHQTKHHTNKLQNENVQCPKCKVWLKCRYAWLHTQKHMIQSISSCKICFTKCRNRRELKEHLKNHGNYRCEMCGFCARQSSVFNKHIEDYHKGKSGDKSKFKPVKRFFIPKNDLNSNKSQILKIYRGLSVSNGVKICILCREICIHYDEMRNHIMNDHWNEVVVTNEYICSCGEVFSNKVLLKHHIFKLKGDHKLIKQKN